MAVYTGKSKQTYQISAAPFAGGGEGDIYQVEGAGGIVAKIYKAEKRTRERELKLTAMAASKPGSIDQYAWPMDVLYDNGKFIGFTMPKVTGKEKLRSIYVYDKRGSNPWTLYIAIAKNLASAVYNVHEIGQVIGDLNPENILVNPKNGLVTLVDTDSYHVRDTSGRVYKCEVGMPEFVAPELQGKHFPSDPNTFNRQTDLFSLAVLVFALLMNGAHPFACKTVSGSSTRFQPIDNMSKGLCAYFPETSSSNVEIPRYAPDMSALPQNIVALFRRAFVYGQKDAAKRPNAEEWYRALESIENHIRICSADAGHLYYDGANECPWCKVRDKMMNIRQSVFANHLPGRAVPNINTTPSGYVYQPAAQVRPVPKKRRHIFRNLIITAVLITGLVLLIKSCTGGPSEAEPVGPASGSPAAQTSGAAQENTGGEAATQTPGTTSPAAAGTTASGSRTTKAQTAAAPAKTTAAAGTTATVKINAPPSISGKSFSGSLTTEKQKNRYTYTPAVTGRYRFDFEISDVNSSYGFSVSDSKGNTLADVSTYSYNGKTVELNAKEKYTVDVYQRSGTCRYTVAIGIPNPVRKASGASISGSLRYTDQQDVYTYTAPKGGRYRFDFDISDVNSSYGFYMQDSKGNTLADVSTYSYSGKTLDLTAGMTYTVKITQRSGLSSYTVTIGVPTDPALISGTSFSGTLKFIDQRDIYTYTAPVSGRYRFDFELDNVSSSYGFYMKDGKGNVLADVSTYSYGGKTLDLTAGTVYTVWITQRSGTPIGYTVRIGVPNVEMSTADSTFSGTLNYTDQTDVYVYTASGTGNYTVSFGIDNASNSYGFYMTDSKGNTLADVSTYSYNKRTVALTAGETYKIKITQRSGYPIAYTIAFLAQ